MVFFHFAAISAVLEDFGDAEGNFLWIVAKTK